uniref:Transcription initiation factor TFIID subunit 6 n=1 Tax=Parastrongyloides trichosuri TaxID=131310 RepID=A0A0N4ZDK7_PARTI
MNNFRDGRDINSSIRENIEHNIKGEPTMEVSPTSSSSTPVRNSNIEHTTVNTSNLIDRSTYIMQQPYNGIHLTDINFSGYTVSKTNGNHLTITLLNAQPDPRGYRMSVDQVISEKGHETVEEPHARHPESHANSTSRNTSIAEMQMDENVALLLSTLSNEMIEKVMAENRRSACIKLYKIYYFLRDMNSHTITARAFAETVSLFFNISPPILRKDIPNYLRPHVVEALKDTKEVIFSLLETDAEKVRAVFAHFFP